MQRRAFITNNSKLIFFSGIYPKGLLSDQEKSTDPVRVIIDADTANEVDDLYAIAWALLEPKLDVIGLTSAQWHTNPRTPNDSVGESQRLNEEILELLGKEHIPAVEGSNFPMVNEQRPQASDAANFIIEQALASPKGEKLSIVILGPCTNIASAVLLEPKIIDKISVNYLGFWYEVKSNTWNKREFNTNNDPNAVNALLNTSNLDFRVMTATTSQHLVFEKSVMDVLLKNRGGIGDYLIDRWENYDRFWQETDKEKRKWIMWDLAILEALAYPEFAEEKEVLTPHDNFKRTIKVFTKINVPEMKANFEKSLDAFLIKSRKKR